VRQVEPAHVLHDEVQRALRLAEVEDLHRVRMLQPRHRRRLVLEALDGVAVFAQLPVQHLHGGDLAHAQMLHSVHHTHAAAPDDVEHSVAPLDDLAEPGAIRLGHPAILG